MEFVLTREISARPEIVFAALTTAEGISEWWGPSDRPVISAEIDGRLGGEFRVRFETDDGARHEAFGRIVGLIPPKYLSLTWSFALGGEPDEAGRESRIDIELLPKEYGTKLVFIHSQLASGASVASHRAGWDASLRKLDRYLSFAEEGDRQYGASTSSVYGYGYGAGAGARFSNNSQRARFVGVSKQR
jgi:uncharacterized protein YndB with AHSA1/START domain